MTTAAVRIRISAANTMTINVTSVNDAPAGADNTVTATEDTDYVFPDGGLRVYGPE